MAQALKRSQTELADARSQCSELQSRLTEAEQAEGALVSLRQELVDRESRVDQLHKECMFVYSLCLLLFMVAFGKQSHSGGCYSSSGGGKEGEEEGFE